MRSHEGTHLHAREAVWIALVALSIVAAGCGRREEFHGPYVVNYTDVRVTLFYVRQGQTTALDVTMGNDGAVPLGIFSDQCSSGTLLALDASGGLVAQRDAPLCAGDIWSIGTRPSASR